MGRQCAWRKSECKYRDFFFLSQIFFNKSLIYVDIAIILELFRDTNRRNRAAQSVIQQSAAVVPVADKAVLSTCFYKFLESAFEECPVR